MSLSGTMTISATIGGVSTTTVVTRTGGGAAPHVITLPAGLDGDVTSGTTTRTLTTDSDHGLTTANNIAIFWDDAGTAKCRYGIAVASTPTSVTLTVSESSVNTGGGGDSFPANGTAIIIGKEVTAPDCDFDGDSMTMFIAYGSQKCTANYVDSGAASLLVHEVLAAGDAITWADNTGITVPITGNAVANVYAYNGSTTAGTYSLNALLDT